MDKRRVVHVVAIALRSTGIFFLLIGAGMWIASRGGPDPSNEWDVFGMLTPVVLALGAIVLLLGWLLARASGAGGRTRTGHQSERDDA